MSHGLFMLALGILDEDGGKERWKGTTVADTSMEHKLKALISLDIYVGNCLYELMKKQHKEKGIRFRPDLFRAVLAKSKYSQEYWEKKGVMFDREGNVLSLGESNDGRVDGGDEGSS